MNIKHERGIIFYRLIAFILIVLSISLVVCSCKKKKKDKNQSAPSVEYVSSSKVESTLESLSISSSEIEQISQESIESIVSSSFSSEISTESGIESETEIVSEYSSYSEPESFSEEIEESEFWSGFESWFFTESESEIEEESQSEEYEEESESISESESQVEEPIIYTVVFKVDDIVLEEQSVNENECALQPQDPQKEKYEFLGWFCNGEEYDFNAPVTSNIVLEAGWKKVVFDVVFMVDNNDYLMQSINNGGYANEPERPQKQGYEFIGWFLNGEKYRFDLPVDKDFELEALFEPLKPIDDFIGQWQGVSDKSGSALTLNILSKSSGTIVRGYGFDDVVYTIKQVVYYQDVLKITYIYEEIEIKMFLKVIGDKLVFVDDLEDEEIVCNKTN